MITKNYYNVIIFRFIIVQQHIQIYFIKYCNSETIINSKNKHLSIKYNFTYYI